MLYTSWFLVFSFYFLLFIMCEPGVSLEAVSLFLRGRGKAVYILLSSDPTLALLLVGFTEYDDDDGFSSCGFISKLYRYGCNYL
ncbi:hypothetical protein Hanom_Chr13g01242271 [Helianthus anomalus]